jgi:2-oxo-4-hydroxy-4-carboxy--5-ureidoimidazoline (OHCU) decarboxylase
MASYIDLASISGTEKSVLLDRIGVAAAIVAYDITQEDPGNAARRAWAKKTFANPRQMAMELYPVLLAANNTATIAQITGAPDATIKSNIVAVINTFTEAP